MYGKCLPGIKRASSNGNTTYIFKHLIEATNRFDIAEGAMREGARHYRHQ